MEVLWVLDHLRDLEADFLRFYRIVDMFEMDSRRFFALAFRTLAYDGVMTARYLEERERNKHAPAQPESQPRRLREAGAEVVSVRSPQRSYIHERLKSQ